MSRYSLNSKVVVITGSTGGLGTAVARALRARGARLALLDLDADALQKQAQSLGQPDVAKSWVADVRSLESLQTAMNAVTQHFGGIDVVIAGAGIGPTGSLASESPAQFERVIDINLNGVWRTFRAALPQVQARKGYLMAISSMAAFVHSPLHGAYVSSKAAVWALCDSVRLELRPSGVGVGSVHPTFFHTPMMEAVFEDKVNMMIWRGNKRGIWKMVPLETVVAAIVDGIERRRDTIVIPRINTIITRAPGVFRRIVEWLGFSDPEIATMVQADAERAASRPG